MFEVKTNQEIGANLKKLILSKYRSCRKFCFDYVDLAYNLCDDPNVTRDDLVRKLTNRLSQILKGTKAIQIYDLPVFSKLLDVSCEEILTAGVVHKPISNRMTNYNIAFSKDPKDWEEYLSKKECMAAYADEFGKTIVDYALEFKNYRFLKFLIDNGYICFVSGDEVDNWRYGIDFGAKSLFKKRFESYNVQQELDENKTLRTQVIALALESNDDSVLENMKARELPPQYTVHPFCRNNITFSEFYDENYIDVIVKSKEKVFNYFCQEYYITDQRQRNQFKWLYPFFDKMIERAIIAKPERAGKLLDIAINYNKNLYDELKKEILRVAKLQRQFNYSKVGFSKIIEMVLQNFYLNEEKNYITFYAYAFKENPICGMVFSVDAKSSNENLQYKIGELNDYYNKIINIRENLIK